MIHILSDKKEECCGCSSCAQICPQECISMVEDREGFLYPQVDASKCINCNLCKKVCPILTEKVFYAKKEEKPPKAVGGWHKNNDIRYESSSGGAFTLFAEYILQQGGVVLGCTLNEDFRAEHVCVESIEDLGKLRGSKYIQSNIGNVYKQVKENLGNGRKVLFVGTPCQCAGLHSFLDAVEKDDVRYKLYSNLYVCDFICHGVPSPKVFYSYISSLEEKYGKKVIQFSFRNKDKGWNPTGLQMGTKIKFVNNDSKRFAPAFKDAYMNGFLDDVYLRPSCYSCEFKKLPKYYSDITIADFWGVKRVDAELCDGKGTSLVLFHSERGQELFNMVKDNFFYKEVDVWSAVKRNKSLIRSVPYNSRRDRFFDEYESLPFQKVKKKYMSAYAWASHKVMKTAWNCIEKMIKIIFTPILKILNQNWDESNWEGFFQFIRFSMIGVTNVMVSYTINVCTLFLLRRIELRFDYVIANITAFFLSVLWSYHWNSRFVFNSNQRGKHWRLKTLIKTYISYAFTGMILNNVLSTIWIQVLGISKYVSPLLNLPFSMPTNFFMQKMWAFNEKKGCKNEKSFKKNK